MPLMINSRDVIWYGGYCVYHAHNINTTKTPYTFTVCKQILASYLLLAPLCVDWNILVTYNCHVLSSADHFCFNGCTTYNITHSINQSINILFSEYICWGIGDFKKPGVHKEIHVVTSLTLTYMIYSCVSILQIDII